MELSRQSLLDFLALADVVETQYHRIARSIVASANEQQRLLVQPVRVEWGEVFR